MLLIKKFNWLISNCSILKKKRLNWVCEAFAGIQAVGRLPEVWRELDKRLIKCKNCNQMN